MPAHGIAQLGIARTFQNLALFPTMTLLENVMVGAHSQGKVGFARAIFRVGRREREPRDPRLRRRPAARSSASARSRSGPATGLPFGTLKRLEIARALAAKPTFLLMDEPASGLTHGEVDELGDTIQQHPRPVRSHGAAGRAPHVDGDEHQRPGRGDGVRPQDRRRHARRGAERPEASSRPTWGPPNDALLRITGSDGRLRPGQRAARHRPARSNEGEIVVMLGANGAGKTTTMRAISGIIPRQGTIEFEGHDIHKASARRHRARRRRAGAAGPRHLPRALGGGQPASPAPTCARRQRRRRTPTSTSGSRCSLVSPSGARQRAGSLSGGEQQMLAIARALMSRPEVAALRRAQPRVWRRSSPRSCSRVHRTAEPATRACRCCSSSRTRTWRCTSPVACYLLETGRIVASGIAEELSADDAIRKAYLGF